MACSALHAETLQGIVMQVSDGDTLWIKTNARSKPIKVRLQGVDAPEVCQLWSAFSLAGKR